MKNKVLRYTSVTVFLLLLNTVLATVGLLLTVLGLIAFIYLFDGLYGVFFDVKIPINIEIINILPSIVLSLYTVLVPSNLITIITLKKANIKSFKRVFHVLVTAYVIALCLLILWFFLRNGP